MPRLASKFSAWFSGISFPSKYGFCVAAFLSFWVLFWTGRMCTSWLFKLHQVVSWKRITQSPLPFLMQYLDIDSYSKCFVILAAILYWFHLPRIESMVDGLPQVRGQIFNILSQYAQPGSARYSQFQLFMYPRRETISESLIENPATQCSVDPSLALALKPGFFVQNIVKNFRE